MENIPFIYIVIVGVLIVYLCIYTIFYSVLLGRVKRIENAIIATFLLKVSKIPGLIEVMRPFIVNDENFHTLTRIHSAAMIQEYQTIYILLEHNARIYEQFSFLMKLGMQIPELQKNTQFIYIRDFVMNYEKNMKNNFVGYNTAVESWNRFVAIKNATIIGFLLPGKKKELI